MAEDEASDGFDGAFDAEFGSDDWEPEAGAEGEQEQVHKGTEEEGRSKRSCVLGANNPPQQDPLAATSAEARSLTSDEPLSSAAAAATASSSPKMLLQQSAPPPPSAVDFGVLPREVLIRVMSFLSAQDLTCAGSCSKMLLLTSSEDLLWRRLYCARWGKPRQPVTGSTTWKIRYADADSEEFCQTLSGAPEELREVFSDMQRAKRQTCLGRQAVDDTAEVPRCQRLRLLAEWRHKKGFDDRPVQRPNLSRTTHHLVRFHRIEPDTFVCEDTGWVHLCDPSCGEGIIDPDSGLITCPVSGRTSQRLMAPHEELSMQQRSVDACFAAADQELASFSAARACTEGYYADAKEMRAWEAGMKLRPCAEVAWHEAGR